MNSTRLHLGSSLDPPNLVAYDNACKYLAEKFPQDFIQWLLPPATPTPIEVLKTELLQEPIRADSLTFLKTGHQILHLEFETRPYSEPPLPLRMLDYYVRLKRQYNCHIEQVVIFLKPIESEQARVSAYTDGRTLHSYRVIRLWEQPPDLLLCSPGLLPLATLSQTDSPKRLLEQVARQIATIEEVNQQANVLACSQLLAGLRFDKKLIQQLLRKEVMRESVIYQEILEEGVQQGLREGLERGWQRGLEEGLERGLEQGLERGLEQGLERGLEQGLERGLEQGLEQGLQQEALSLVKRQLTRRLGILSPEVQSQIEFLSRQELEDLGEALLDFSQIEDLITWLSED